MTRLIAHSVSMSWIFIVVLIAALVAISLRFWRQADARNDKATAYQLMELADSSGRVFTSEMVSNLPEAAKRYFQFTIAEGAVLHTATRIDMDGKIGLGNLQAPKYRPMRATQLLVPPHGLVWELRAGAISGSDGMTPSTSWTRFWLFGWIPVVRVGGTSDHHRSAFGRVIAEAAFWAPACLLPSAQVKWRDVDRNIAEALITAGGHQQTVRIHIDHAGQPKHIIIQRWSNENSERVFREQPFGGEVSNFKDFEGYRLPTHVEGGNHFGTNDYFPFYKTDVTDIRFPASGDAS